MYIDCVGDLQLDEPAVSPSPTNAPSFSAGFALVLDSVRVVGEEAPRPEEEEKGQKKDGHSSRQDPSDPLYR